MRLLQRATSTSPYHRDIVGMNPLARVRMRSRFDAAATLRTDVGPAGRFRDASRAVNSLKYILSGRTLQDLFDE